jgi:biotin carboxyl carrier protein
MKLDATIADTQTTIDLRDEGERAFAEIDGRSYQLDVQELATGRYALMCEGRVFECRVEGTPESGKTLEVFVGTRQFPIAVTDPKRLRSAATASAHADGAARIIAPMPGKVVRVLVEAGAQVETGDGIVVVEAMKMQNEMKSPKAGKVSSLNVQQGATVNAGDVLAVVE